MIMIELLCRDLLREKGFKVDYVGNIPNLGYDLILNDKIKVELKSTHYPSFSVRRDSGNHKTYKEKLDFLIMVQCFNKDIIYWVFPGKWGKEYGLFRMPYQKKDIKKYRNNFSLIK